MTIPEFSSASRVVVVTITIRKGPEAGVAVPAIPEQASPRQVRSLPGTVSGTASPPAPAVALLLPRQGCQLVAAGPDWRARWLGADAPCLATAIFWGQRHALTAGHCLRSAYTLGSPLAAGQALLLAGPNLSPGGLTAGHWQTVRHAFVVDDVPAGNYAAQHPGAGDWALLSLSAPLTDATVSGRMPALAECPEPGDRCWRFSPGRAGQPALELAECAGEWVVTGESCPLWLARLDSARGLSGSPVLNSHGQLAGLLLGRVGQAGEWYRRWLPGADQAGPLEQLARVMPARHFAGQLPVAA